LKSVAARRSTRPPTVWRQRYQDRQELARSTDRDLHDVGLSWSDIANEVDKPLLAGLIRQPSAIAVI